MIVDPFHADLHKIVHEQINDRLAALGGGSALTYDMYKTEVGYLRALSDVLEWCKTVEETRYGSKSKDM